MTTRSKVLAVGHIDVPTGEAIYTAPASSVVLLKSVLIYNSAAASVTIQMNLVSHLQGTNIQFLVTDLASGKPHFEETWVVLEAEDVIGLTVSGGPVTWWLSGAELPPRAN